MLFSKNKKNLVNNKITYLKFMKKLIFSALIFTALISCKKTENTEPEATTENNTEIIDSTSTSSKNIMSSLSVVDQNQLTTLVAPKKKRHYLCD